jgi:hypothetical protein
MVILSTLHSCERKVPVASVERKWLPAKEKSENNTMKTSRRAINCQKEFKITEPLQ